MKNPTILIGNLADRIGVQPEAIRYYERRGLLPQPKRAANGYRVYSPEHVNSVEFIKRAQSLGFSLDEIREMMELRSRPDSASEHVGKLLREKIETVDVQINGLQILRRELMRSLRECDKSAERHPADSCPVLARLDRGPNGKRKPKV